MENKRLFGLLCCLQRELSRNIHASLSEYGVSGIQLHTLISIKRESLRGGTVCQRDIERQTGLRPSSVSTMLGNLEKNGLILRVQAEDDGRAKNLVLTEKGEELCRKNKKVMESCDKQLQSALTEEEQEQLEFLLEKVLSGTSCGDKNRFMKPV